MVKISLKVLLVLLISTNSWSVEDCKLSLFQYRDKALCFSTKYRSYLTQECAKGNCHALELYKRKTSLRAELKKSDSRHPGALACKALGGRTTVVVSLKTADEICLCVAKDQSAISCSSLGMH